jgi:hypothetical protein
MRTNRRTFICAASATLVASACGEKGSPIAPGHVPVPSPSQQPVQEKHPSVVSFTDSSTAERIGGVRKVRRYGTLKEIIEHDNIPSETNAAGLVTMFDSVRPPSSRGIIFLIKGVRFEGPVATQRMDGNDEWAAYQWMGYR